MTEEQRSKLPRWAQAEFTRLEANLRHANDKAAKTLVDAEPDRPAYGDYDDLRGKGLPCRTVWFRDHGISVRVGRDGVEIHGDGALSIHPHVTNVVTVKSERIDRE